MNLFGSFVVLFNIFTTSARRVSSDSSRSDLAYQLIDLTAVFGNNLSDSTSGSSAHLDKVFSYQGKKYKCCCSAESCRVASVEAENACSKRHDHYRSWSPLDSAKNQFRDPTGCGCLVGSGYRSWHHKRGTMNKTCKVSLSQGAAVMNMTQEHLIAVKADAERSFMADGWKATYGECSNTCGYGFRQRLELEPCDKQTRILETCADSEPSALAAQVSCVDASGCKWACGKVECGWSDVECQGSGSMLPGELCHILPESKKHFANENCYQPCKSEDEISTICAVAVNHLDEQYGSLQTLVDKTCVSENGDHSAFAPSHSGPRGRPTLKRPDLLVFMTQELQHANKVNNKGEDFHKFVNDDALAHYRLAGECVGNLSASVAVYVRTEMWSRVFPVSVTCEHFISMCDWTNCKGSAVMTMMTTSGKLILASSHLARAGQISAKRVKQFEIVANAIASARQGDRQSLVIFGGDSNVRSEFREDVSFDQEYTAEQVRQAAGPDILGHENWTLDQHLEGRVGLNSRVRIGLQDQPLFQAKSWDKLCPFYRKTNETAGKKVKVKSGTKTKPKRFRVRRRKDATQDAAVRNTLACRSPEDQLASGDNSQLEFFDVSSIKGCKSRAPSWTMRVFLSEVMYEACGKLMKDIRNLQTDHDPVFVRCLLPKGSTNRPQLTTEQWQRLGRKDGRARSLPARSASRSRAFFGSGRSSRSSSGRPSSSGRSSGMRRLFGGTSKNTGSDSISFEAA